MRNGNVCKERSLARKSELRTSQNDTAAFDTVLQTLNPPVISFLTTVSDNDLRAYLLCIFETASSAFWEQVDSF